MRYQKVDRTLTNSINSESGKKPKLAVFYNRTQILKNKVEKDDEKRPSTTSQQKRNRIIFKNNPKFFPT